MKKVFAGLIALSCMSSMIAALPVNAESMSTTFPISRPTEETVTTTEEETVATTPDPEEETIVTTLDPEQEATASTSVTTTTVTTTTTTVTEEPTEDEDHEFIVNIMNEFSVWDYLNLNTTVRFVQTDEDGEEIAEVARWNPAEENPYRISHELLTEDAVYSVVIDELPEGYSYTYKNKNSVKDEGYKLSDLESGDEDIYLFIRHEPAREQMQFPVAGTVSVNFYIEEKYVWEDIPDVDATIAMLNEDGTVKEVIGTWNTAETPVFSFELTYSFEDEQSRIPFGIYIENLPEEYINPYSDEYILQYFGASELELMQIYGEDEFSAAVYFEKKDAEYTYTTTENVQTTTTTTVETTAATTGSYFFQSSPTETTATTVVETEKPVTDTTRPKTYEEWSSWMSSRSSTTETTTTTTVTTTETIKTGDVNEDGSIDILDVIKLNRAVLGKELLTDAQNKAADVNKDNNVDATDSLAIMKYMVGLIETFDDVQ